MNPRRPMFGAAMLLIAAVVWGFAFIPQKWSVVALPPLTATALRFALAAPVLALVAGRRLHKPGVPRRHALMLGVLLYVAYALQTVALTLTPVARVSLITGLYAVFVPLLAPLFGHLRPSALHWAGAGVAFGGLLGLVGVVGARDALTTPLSLGDLWTLLHALLGALQVLLIGRLAQRADVLSLNALQIGVIACIAVPVSLAVEGAWDATAILEPRLLLSLLYLAVFSTVVAFSCQIIGQRHASPPAAAVIMLLEAPVGVLGAMVLFNESMALSQWVGAGVLLCGVVLSLVAEVRRPPSSADHRQG